MTEQSSGYHVCGGSGGGGYDEQLLPKVSCFAVTLFGQQPYLVPLHPPME
jgi:hypothetical protein